MKLSLMKMLLMIAIAISCFTPIYSQTFNWVKGGGSTSLLSSVIHDEAVYFMCVDNNKNIYTLSVVGNSPPIVADTFIRSSGAYGSNQNAFFASYTCDGHMRFAKLISGTQVIPQGISVDNSGHVYLAIDLPHTTASGYLLRLGYDTTITGYLASRESLIQYDTSGHLNWIRFVGNNTSSSYSGVGGVSNYLALDGSQNPHLICGLYSGVVFQPGDTSRYGYTDLKYDVTGSLSSIKHIQLDSTLGISGICIDKQSNKLYAFGYRSPAFPDSSLYSYIAELDVNRNVIWKDTLANPYYPGSQGFLSLVADGFGHLYGAVVSPKSIIYKGDTVSNPLTTSLATFTAVMKLDTAGNKIWTRGFYGASSASGGVGYLSLMPNNKIAVGGTIAGKIVSGSDTAIIFPGEGQNALFSVLDSAGYVHTLQQLHGSGFYDKALVMASDKVGNLYIGGQVENNIYAGSITPYSSIGGNTDFFIMKYGVDCGCTAMPVANYSVSGAVTKTFIYTGTTSGIDSVRWHFGDGSTSTAFSPTHTYLTAGTFTACITVYSSCGSDMHCSEITIDCVAPPVAAYTFTGTGLTKSFTYSAPLAGITTISWTFGDGGTGTGATFSHTYAAAGTYTVCVTSTNSCGTNTHCAPVVACATVDTASYSVTGVGHTRSFSYTGITTGIDSVKWDFGDGTSAIGLTPSHTYLVGGTYHVCATVYTHCGNDAYCTDVIVSTTAVSSASSRTDIKVYPNPATNELYITSVPISSTFRLLNMTGISVQHGQLSEGNNTIQLINMAPGVYILEMTGADGQRNMVRVVKQ